MKNFSKTWKSDLINTTNHWAVGTVWNVVGSKGNSYKVSMHDKGFECNCPAFKKCKHISEIEQGFCYD